MEGNIVPIRQAKACTRCGKCCTNPDFMGSLSASSADLNRWKKEKREDILAYVSVIGKNGDLWISPITGNEMPRCPFVRKDRNRPTYACTIYETRPETCRAYEPWAPGSICEDV